MEKFFLLETAVGIDKRSIGYRFSWHKGEPYPWPDGLWNPLDGMRYLNKQKIARFNDEMKFNLPKLIAVIRPKVKELPDAIGQFSSDVTEPPMLMSGRTKSLIEQIAPESCEFISGPSSIWDQTFERDLDASDYFFSNVILQIDSWNDTLCGVRKMKRSDGSALFFLRGPGVVKETAVENAVLWRDSRTKHILCSERFKEAVQALNLSNFYFRPLKSDLNF